VQVERLPDGVCQRLGELIADHTGLHFPPERHPDLQRGLVSAAAEFGFPDSYQCANWLLSTPLTRQQLNVLASHLTIGETYFFRERKFFEMLAEHILPELLQRRRGHRQSLRLWSAACCTGEEAYSLAILIDQLLGQSPDWQVTILGTDINERFLRKATEGVYGEWSFRDAPPGLKERYFTRTPEGRFAIRPQIKRRVRFTHMNLAGPALETDAWAMDLILCRNVLMYFTPPQAQQLVDKLHHALTDGGWLAVAPSECSQTLFSRFALVTFPNILIYRKQLIEEARPQAPPPVVEAPPRQNHFSRQPTPRAAPVPTPHSYEVATGLYGEGRYTEATDILLGWLRQSPPTPPATAPSTWNPGLLALLTRSLANQGRHAEALTWSEHWVEADKVDPAAHYLQAIIQQETGAHEAARRSLQRVLYLKPDFVLAHVALAHLSLADPARVESRQVQATRHLQNAAYALRACAPDEPVPESGGLTARGLLEVITEAIRNDEP
jgi:chemotaxis protein methyltransferase CheR